MPAPATFDFGASCLLPQAEVLRYALIGKLSKGRAKALRLDLSKVEAADLSLLQMLVALRRSAEAKGIALTLRSSPVVDALLARAGAPALAGIPGETE